MAVAFLITVVTTNAFLSMLVTFCVYIIGHSLETIVKIVLSGEFIKVGPMYAQMLKFFTWFFPNLSAFNLKGLYCLRSAFIRLLLYMDGALRHFLYCHRHLFNDYFI